MANLIPVPGAGQHGLITDLPFEQLPLNAWTDCRNVRFREGVAEKFFGHAEVFPGLLYSPQFLLQSALSGTAYWLYASANSVGATDGATHANITRASGGYNVNPSTGWTAATIEDIPVINNGTDVPQAWNKPALNVPLVDLPNWPAGVTAKSIAALKRYLIALNVTKANVNHPTMIKWSHEAPTGGVPASWDETNESMDAGEYVLPGAGGPLVDGVPLRDVLMLYKEFQAWQMQYIGGVFVFRFSRVFEHVGALSRRSAVEFFSGKHLVFTGNDIVQHDGHQAESLITGKMRSFITNNLDEVNYNKSFVAVDADNSEVWVCWPGRGQSWCTFAAVWNWRLNTWGIRELPGVSYMVPGLVVPVDISQTWAGAVGGWSTDTEVWGDRSADPTKRRLLMAVPGSNQLFVPNATQQFAGTNMTAYVERQGIGFPVRTGTPPDFTRMKQVDKLYPHITGTIGGVVKVSLGVQDKFGDSPRYGQAQAFKIGTTHELDFGGSESARLHSLKFESDSDIQWKLGGYDVTVIDRGNA